MSQATIYRKIREHGHRRTGGCLTRLRLEQMRSGLAGERGSTCYGRRAPGKDHSPTPRHMAKPERTRELGEVIRNAPQNAALCVASAG